MSIYGIQSLFLLSLLGLFALTLLGSTFFTVEQRTVAVVQRLGKFLRQAEPGLQVKVPLIDRVVGRINLRVQQLDVAIETKTEDNVFVRLVIAVQYFVLPDKVYDAFYKLDDANRQITSFVFDVVRARVPRIKLDDVFEKKDEIADVVKTELSQVMDGFGYGILKALVTDIEPDVRVKESMNEINAAQRLRMAATERGEADRILKVKAAEGDAQSKALQGRGIADQRQAIVAGLRDSVDEFRKSVPGTTARDVMNLVLMTQYFDMLKEIGASSRTNAILIPHSPGNLSSLTEQMRNAIMEAEQTVRPPEAQRSSAADAQSPPLRPLTSTRGMVTSIRSTTTTTSVEPRLDPRSIPPPRRTRAGAIRTCMRRAPRATQPHDDSALSEWESDGGSVIPEAAARREDEP